MNKQALKIRLAEQVAQHLKQLKAIGYKYDTLQPLEALELKANKMATDECNGEREYSILEWNNLNHAVIGLFKTDIRNYGFFINTDPRGYALKLKDVKYEDRVISYSDMGGYQILCPQFEN